jgi:hypothetical protein
MPDGTIPDLVTRSDGLHVRAVRTDADPAGGAFSTNSPDARLSTLISGVPRAPALAAPSGTIPRARRSRKRSSGSPGPSLMGVPSSGSPVAAAADPGGPGLMGAPGLAAAPGDPLPPIGPGLRGR